MIPTSISPSTTGNRRKHGAALAMALWVLMILMILGFAFITSAVTELKATQSAADAKTAFYIADAGIEDALTNWFTPQILAQLERGGLNATYNYNYQNPVNGQSTQLGFYQIYVDKVSPPGDPPLYRIMSFGSVGELAQNRIRAQRRLWALVKQKNPGYVIFMDDAINYTEGGSKVGEVNWGSGSTVNGDFFANSDLRVQDSATFEGKVKITGTEVGGGDPIYKQGLTTNADPISFPVVNLERLKNIAQSEPAGRLGFPPCGSAGRGRYTPYYWSVSCRSCPSPMPWNLDYDRPDALPIHITLHNGFYTAGGSSWISARGISHFQYPTNGILFCNCDVIVSGKIKGQMTIVSTGTILINGDISYADSDSMLGLIAKKRILFHGQRSMKVCAAMLALNDGCTYEFQNPLSTAWGGPRQRVQNGTLEINGCLYSRHAICLNDSSGKGYTQVTYNYDQRLSTTQPPGFPVIATEGGNYEMIYWTDVSAGSGK